VTRRLRSSAMRAAEAASDPPRRFRKAQTTVPRGWSKPDGTTTE
jgi:hypothetical protein